MTPQAPPMLRHQAVSAMADLIATVDQRAADVNRRWGFNRLPHIVPIEWMERFKSQKIKWSRACFEFSEEHFTTDLDTVRKHGEAMLRAFDKLEQVAAETGHAPAAPGVWEFELQDGTPIVLVRTSAERSQIERNPPAQVWDLQEIARVIETMHTAFPLIYAAKDAFPQSELVQMATGRKITKLVDDELAEIPFA